MLVDAFAGPGKMADGSPGSPLIMAGAAERYVRDKYKAYFFNNDLEHHSRLQRILEKRNWPSCSAILGDGIENLRPVIESLTDETFFLYIDPFGLDCEFNVLRPLLDRSKKCSTEILINLHMPITHRLGSRNQLSERHDSDPTIRRYHEKLNRVYGGDYWADELLSDGDTKEREKRLIAKYCSALSSTGYLAYTGACPIRESNESATKYFMVFASSHIDSMLIFNDEMCKSYNKYMNDQTSQGGLFAGLTWQDWRDSRKLTELVVEYVKKYPATTRKELWNRIG